MIITYTVWFALGSRLSFVARRKWRRDGGPRESPMTLALKDLRPGDLLRYACRPAPRVESGEARGVQSVQLQRRDDGQA